jgi:hypothetical protein
VTLWLSTRRAPWCLLAAIALVAVIGTFGAVTLSVPSLVSSGLPLPVAAVAPLAIPVALSWALTSSDPLVESVAARKLGLLDTGFVVSLTALAIVGVIATAIVGRPEIVGLAARDIVGYVGLMLLGRAVLRRDAAAVVPVAYLIVTAFFAGAADADAPWWAWAIRPADDPTTWVIASLLFATGCLVLTLDRRVRWVDADA